MYQVRDGFCFSAISFDWVNILSSYKDQIKANVFSQLLSADIILISYTEKKLWPISKSDVFGTKKFLAPGKGTPRKMGKYEVKTP